MPWPEITGQCTNYNYLSADGTDENLSLIGASCPIGKKVSLSVGIGGDFVYGKTSDGDRGLTTNAAFEAKAKYNIGEHINAQARFRKIGSAEQYRVTFGGSYAFDKNNSIYSSAHFTSKHTDEWKHNAGGWVGYTHKFNNGASLSAELQQNIPIKNKTAPDVGKTLGSFDSNKMFNVILSIPIK